jgi:DNA replication protein DnaC
MADQTFNFRRQPRVISSGYVKDDCKHHGEYQRHEVEQFDGSYLRAGCRKCRWDSLNREPEDSDLYKAAAVEKEAEQVNNLLIGSGITPRFRECTLDTYLTAGDQAKVQALAECRQYVQRFDENYEVGRCLILSGNVGTGKTHLASGMARAVIQQYGASALIVTVAEIVRVAKETMIKGVKFTERDVIDELAGVELLLIDEVGAQRGTEYEQALLHEVIDRRYQLMIPTVLISNELVDNLKSFIGQRALDRLRENGGQAVGFTWASARGAV